MREANSEFLQEEARLRGARPRVKAVLSPFELDTGLAPGSGEFVHTAWGGEPGKLVLESGYHTSGSWTSPVMHTYSPHLNLAAPFWEDQGGVMEPRVYLRTGADAAQTPEAPLVPMTPGEEADLQPYFQMRVEFQQRFRSWAVDSSEEADSYTAYGVIQAPEGGYESYVADGSFPGAVAGLRLEGWVGLLESEILDPGRLQVNLARDFSQVRDGRHVLIMDNRRGQWLMGGENFYLRGLDWREKLVTLRRGWELPNGLVAWQLVYEGVLEGITGMAHGWRDRHRAGLESRSLAAVRLQRLLGAPSADGEKRPFMRGAYVARGELQEVIPALVGDPVKTGSGSATLQVAGTFRGDYDRAYLVEAETGGEVGGARFRWSVNQGQTWRETDCLTAGPENPVELEEGLAVYWESGPGTDLAAGDHWTFTAAAPRYRYAVPGAPFEAVTAVFLNGEATWAGVAADPALGLVEVIGHSALVEARIVKAGPSHPVDIISDILTEVGLEEAIHRDSFDLARSLTPEYAIGVRFENVSAAQALREILKRCLYDLWVDFGEIKLRAYLGDE
ncbi:MAG: hypothetical protein FJ134_09090 [Deltaproteobacteria bacterium]|nr:hypothetical protein [Deltaproteobacteria bacterium]